MKDGLNILRQYTHLVLNVLAGRVDPGLLRNFSESSIQHVKKHLVAMEIIEGPMQNGPRHQCQIRRIPLFAQRVCNIHLALTQELEVRNPSGEYGQVGHNQSSVDPDAFIKPSPFQDLRSVSLMFAILNKRFTACGEFHSRVEQP